MSGRPPRRGRWLAYAIPAVLLAIVIFQAVMRDSIDYGVLGLLALFGFGALGWTLDDVIGSNAANAVRENIRAAVDEAIPSATDGAQPSSNDSPRASDDDRQHDEDA